MCLNCGCGSPDMRHKDTDITREDVRRAAKGQGKTLEETAANMVDAVGRMSNGSREFQPGMSGNQPQPR